MPFSAPSQGTSVRGGSAGTTAAASAAAAAPAPGAGAAASEPSEIKSSTSSASAFPCEACSRACACVRELLTQRASGGGAQAIRRCTAAARALPSPPRLALPRLQGDEAIQLVLALARGLWSLVRRHGELHRRLRSAPLTSCPLAGLPTPRCSHRAATQRWQRVIAPGDARLGLVHERQPGAGRHPGSAGGAGARWGGDISCSEQVGAQ